MDTSVSRLLKIAEAHALTDVALAGLLGISPQTIRVVRITGKMPARASCRARIESFVAANAGATSRAQLRACA